MGNVIRCFVQLLEHLSVGTLERGQQLARQHRALLIGWYRAPQQGVGLVRRQDVEQGRHDFAVFERLFSDVDAQVSRVERYGARVTFEQRPLAVQHLEKPSLRPSRHQRQRQQLDARCVCIRPWLMFQLPGQIADLLVQGETRHAVVEALRQRPVLQGQGVQPGGAHVDNARHVFQLLGASAARRGLSRVRM